MREVAQGRNHILLNGRPLHLRGTVENAVFPKTGHARLRRRMGAYHAHRQGLRTEPHPFPLVVPSCRGFPHGRLPRRLPRSRDAHVGQGRRAGRSALRLLPPRDARHPQGVRQPPLVRPLLQRQRDHRQLRLHRGADRRRPQTRHAASVQRFGRPARASRPTSITSRSRPTKAP